MTFIRNVGIGAQNNNFRTKDHRFDFISDGTVAAIKLYRGVNKTLTNR
jgi:hypothetical protein